MAKKASPNRHTELCSRAFLAVAGFFCARTARRRRPLALLRLASLGSPEKTIQGELLFHLRSKGFYAVSECALRLPSGRRNVDIAVFDRTWRPALVIEIKHYSANQGGQGTLFRRLREDFKRERPSDHKGHALPLLQVGLFTAVTSISPKVSQRSTKTGSVQQFYRFLYTYCVPPVHPPWQGLGKPRVRPFRRRGIVVQHEEFFVDARDEKFRVPISALHAESGTVGGRVGAWLILSKRAR